MTVAAFLTISVAADAAEVMYKIVEYNKQTAEFKIDAVHCNFVIDKSIHTRMKYLAIEKNMSLRNIVNEAMKEYLEKHEK